MIFLKVTLALRIRHFKNEKKTNITLIYRIPKIQENKILYTRISAQKYRIPWLKTPKIPYTQNPWLGLNKHLITGKSSVLNNTESGINLHDIRVTTTPTECNYNITPILR